MSKFQCRGSGHIVGHAGLSISAVCAFGILVGIPVNGWTAERFNDNRDIAPRVSIEVAQSKMPNMGNHERSHGATADDTACDIEVELTAAAERQLGGSLYDGPMPTPDEIMATMKMAHRVHHPQLGGAFAMAPNKMHHVEVVYSEDCGLRVYLYNAYTKHIRVERFMAFVEFIPRDEDQFEVIRFVRPSKNGDYLATGADHGVEPPFDIHLFMRFPESDAVELFTVKPNFKKHKLFVGQGEVITIDKEGSALVIDHDAIPGYMSAMKMPYAVREAGLLDRVEPGMQVIFKVDAENGIIVAIEPTSQ